MKTLLLRLLRIPGEPQAPPGSHASVKAFRASPKFLQYLIATWMVNQIFAALGLVFTLIGVPILAQFDIEIPVLTNISQQSWFRTIEYFAVFGFFVQLFFGLFLIRLRYEQRWYLVSRSALRIREGLFFISEQTLTIANIQNMKVTQGPIQRIFGISDLSVETAGGGDALEEATEGLHQGVLRGLENAREVRDQLRDAIAQFRDSGLGDPDEPAQRKDTAPTVDEQNTVAAAERALFASRQLREVL